MQGAFQRSADRSVRRLSAPVRTDLLGTALLYFTVIDGAAHVSASVRALARLRGTATLDPLALPEALAFGLTLDDRTVLAEVRSIPPHATLHPDGRIERHAGPVSTGAITDGEVAATRLRGLLEDIVRDQEARHPAHLVGFTGRKDSRILAALPKGDPDRWHYVSISGRDDAEHQGASATASRLGLRHYRWMEWTEGFVAGPGVHRVSADLCHGVGALSDTTLLRGYLEQYRAEALGEDAALWIGALADSLFAPTYLAPEASTLWGALSPRTGHLPRVLSPAALQRFEAERGFYESNPYDFTAPAEETGFFLRLLSRGRSYICRLLSCFDRVCRTQLNPYLHPAVIELALSLDPRLRHADASRIGVLRSLGPGLDGPSAFGYRAPSYAGAVLSAVTREVRLCAALDGLLEPTLLSALRDGAHPALVTDAPGGAGPTYRTFEGPGAPLRSLRDYEHLLVYASFLNLLAEDGVALRA